MRYIGVSIKDGASSMKKENRQIWISYLRISATIGIVLLHTFSTITSNPDLFPLIEQQKKYYIAGHLVWRWTVPIFLMITGCLLLDPAKKITYSDCIKKYINRVLGALVVFGIPFSALINISNGKTGFSLLIASAIGIVKGETFSHLWYLYALIGIYLTLPLLKSFIDKCYKTDLEILLFILFVFALVIPAASRLSGVHIEFTVPLGWTVFYVLCGFYFNEYTAVFNKNWIIFGFSLLTALLLIFSFVGFFTGEWEHYDNPVIAANAIFMFLIFKKTDKTKSTKSTDILWKLDRLCFGEYLIHPLFLQIAYRVLRLNPTIYGSMYLVSTLGLGMIVALLSFIGSWALAVIPFFKNHIL